MSAPTAGGDLALVMPMAGRGSRFRRHGQPVPKPLIDLAGRPFFRWAVESVARAVPVRELVFVVLAEHVREHAIDGRIAALYPAARIVVLPEVTAGAAETAMAGVAALRTEGPFAVNDCDHAFDAGDLRPLAARLAASGPEALDGALLGFAASSPAYSYVRLDARGAVQGTVEKAVVSPFAIAGCYLFADAGRFGTWLARYRHACPYGERFLSGIYNEITAAGGPVAFHALARHVSFGTPEELARVTPALLAGLEPAGAAAGG